MMSLGFVYWLILLLVAIFGIGWNRPALGTPASWGPFGVGLVFWILFVILGLAEFGWPISGTR